MINWYLNLILTGLSCSLRDSIEMAGCSLVTLGEKPEVSGDAEFFEP